MIIKLLRTTFFEREGLGGGCFARVFAWVRRVVVAVLMLAVGVQAGYKPVDVSDIQGEEREALEGLWGDLKSLPHISREAYICEQLGLTHCKDYAQAIRGRDGHPATDREAYFVGSEGKVIHFVDAVHAAGEMWYRCYHATPQFKAGAALVPFEREVQKVVCNTAGYLLRSMPGEHRWLALALMGNMVYDAQGNPGLARCNWEMEDGTPVKVPQEECRGYSFMDPEGKEQDIRAVLSDGRDWRWRQVVWRCENLVGAEDILALFPEEVGVMREQYKQRLEGMKDEADARNEAMLAAADEEMSALTKEKRLARIALAMGLYYLDHKEAGCADGRLNPEATIILPDGTKHSGEEFVGEAPGTLQQVPHEAILKHYREPIEQMARQLAKARFKGLPAPLRDLLRAQLSDKLIKIDGTPVRMKSDHWRQQTFDRRWDLLPKWTAEPENTWFVDSRGNKCPFNIFKPYFEEYGHTVCIAYLCARILGKAETVKLIPLGGGEDLPTEQRRAWLAEKMGFCFTEDGGAAYQSERTANEDAVYVDAEGTVRKLSEVNGKDSAEWAEATRTARIVGYERFTAPYKEELKQLAAQTSKHILASMPLGLRWSWLAENNEFLFIPNGKVPYSKGEGTLESGVKYSIYHGTGFDYGRCQYYDPSGHAVPTMAVAGVWDKRWWLLYYCGCVAGMDAINALFAADVKAMREQSKQQFARLRDEEKAKNDAMLDAADEEMSTLSKERRLARIALAMGLYYLNHRDAGYADGHLNPEVTVILPDGTKHSGEEIGDETPGALQQVPHEAILGYYRGPIEQMAREVAKERFKEMPPMLRDLWRALLARKFIKLDGSPAEIEEGISTVQTFDRAWRVPMDAVDHQKTYFKKSQGQSIPYGIVDSYHLDYGQTCRLVNLCARILGKEETAELIPPGDEANMTAEQQRAWLAEKMGFCFTEDGAPAYQSERTANENAVYVDAEGTVRKLSEVSGKDSAGWTEATNAALAVGYDRFTAPYKEELKQLAVQTSKHILTSMPPGLRWSWLAENNELFFVPNGKVPYDTREGETLESGVKYSIYHSTGFDYGRCLYCDPSGNIVPTTAVGEAWDKRWWLLYYCENVAGIDAINAQFSAEVESMRTQKLTRVN